jgi:hypothetical protein
MVVLDLWAVVSDHRTTAEYVIIDLIAGPLRLGEVPLIPPVVVPRPVRMLDHLRILRVG